MKERGKHLFDPLRGGTYAVFDHRPLSDEVREYCTQDVTLMPHLREKYREKLCNAWWKRIEAETNARIRLSQSPTFAGKGQHMAQAPSAWMYWRPSRTQRLARTMVEVVAPRIAVSAMTADPSSVEVGSARSREGDHLAQMLRRVALTGIEDNFDIDSNDRDAADGSGREGVLEGGGGESRRETL